MLKQGLRRFPPTFGTQKKEVHVVIAGWKGCYLITTGETKRQTEIRIERERCMAPGGAGEMH